MLLRIAEQRPEANHGGTAARALSGLMIFLTVVGRNLLGDALQRRLDPTAQERADLRAADLRDKKNRRAEARR
jgi:hypothetical protein